MTNDDKNKFDALEQLRAAAWDSFDKRRNFEWRVCIALWTAFAAFIGAVLTGKAPSTTTTATGGTIIIALAIIILHCIWLHGLCRANKADKDIAVFFEEQMMVMLNTEFSNNIKEQLKTIRDSGNWNSLFQIGVTTILALGAIITIWSASEPKTPEQLQKQSQNMQMESNVINNVQMQNTK
jgi:hypothetical protein